MALLPGLLADADRCRLNAIRKSCNRRQDFLEAASSLAILILRLSLDPESPVVGRKAQSVLRSLFDSLNDEQLFDVQESLVPLLDSASAKRQQQFSMLSMLPFFRPQHRTVVRTLAARCLFASRIPAKVSENLRQSAENYAARQVVL